VQWGKRPAKAEGTLPVRTRRHWILLNSMRRTKLYCLRQRVGRLDNSSRARPSLCAWLSDQVLVFVVVRPRKFFLVFTVD